MNAVRVISALLLIRFLKPVFYIVCAISVGLYVLTAILAVVFSSWWWLILVVLIPATMIFIVVSLIVRFVLKRLVPQHLKKEDHVKLDGFIDTLFGIAERTKTPYPVLLFLVAKDVVRGKESSFLKELLGDSKKVLNDFGDIKAILRSKG